MSTTTTNYGLTKPALTDSADITAMNGNWDKIDTELKKKYDPNNKPTAADVGARPNTWMPTAADVGAAPVGFGLGHGSVMTENVQDTNFGTGWYGLLSTGLNYPEKIPNAPYGCFEVQNRYGDKYILFKFGDYRVYCRYDGTKWWEWEYENPPLTLGVEYRTTERINQKAVYKRNNNGIIEYRLDGDETWKPYAEAVGGVQTNPNLLRNWYFGNPVNQRGQTTYPRAIDYCIDGWRRYNYATDVLTDCIRIYEGGHQISQFLEHPISGTVTLSVLFKNRTGAVLKLGWNNAVETALAYVASTNDAEGLLTATFDATDLSEILIGSRTGGTNDSVDLIAAKLEFGSVQTLAHQDANGNWVLNEIPDKNVELLKCCTNTAKNNDTYANHTIFHTGNKDQIFTSSKVTLTTGGWVLGSDERYYQTVNVTGVTTTSTVFVDVDLSTTDVDAKLAYLEAWAIPSANEVAQGTGTLTFYAWEKPTVNIPVNVGVV